MDKPAFGSDMRKWYIVKHNGRWSICPPVTDNPEWMYKGGRFDTGAQAHAAFSGRRR